MNSLWKCIGTMSRGGICFKGFKQRKTQSSLSARCFCFLRCYDCCRSRYFNQFATWQFIARLRNWNFPYNTTVSKKAGGTQQSHFKSGLVLIHEVSARRYENGGKKKQSGKGKTIIMPQRDAGGITWRCIAALNMKASRNCIRMDWSKLTSLFQSDDKRSRRKSTSRTQTSIHSSQD